MTGQRCPMGGPRCPESICDCFIDQFPDDPLRLHPELFTLGSVATYADDSSDLDAARHDHDTDLNHDTEIDYTRNEPA